MDGDLALHSGSPVAAGSATHDDLSAIGAERLAAAALARAFRDAAGRGQVASEAHAWLLSPPGRRLARLLGYGDKPVPSREQLRALADRGWSG